MGTNSQPLVLQCPKLQTPIVTQRNFLLIYIYIKKWCYHTRPYLSPPTSDQWRTYDPLRQSKRLLMLENGFFCQCPHHASGQNEPEGLQRRSHHLLRSSRETQVVLRRANPRKVPCSIFLYSVCPLLLSNIKVIGSSCRPRCGCTRGSIQTDGISITNHPSRTYHGYLY